jgi:hypothetical protein
MTQTESKAICRRHLLTKAGVSAGAMLLARRPVLAGTSFKSIKQIVAGVFMQLIAEIHRMQHQPFIAGPDVVSEGR